MRYTYVSDMLPTIPSKTLPNTTCFPSNHGVLTVVIKNWEPFVSLPEFAMLNRPTSTIVKDFEILILKLRPIYTHSYDTDV